MIFIEIKKEDGNQSPKQKLFEKEVMLIGLIYEYYVVRNINDLRDIFPGYKQKLFIA